MRHRVRVRNTTIIMLVVVALLVLVADLLYLIFWRNP